jgi:hypothetical protein
MLHSKVLPCEPSSNNDNSIAAGTSTETPTAASTGPDDTASSSSAVCNGHKNLCDLPVNSILFATVHNAQSSSEDGFTIAANHQYNLEAALDAGYRGVNLDFGICSGQLQLVHGFCGLGSRDPSTAFTNILGFLIDNPYEVVLIPTQIDNELEGEVSNDDIDAIFESIQGFKDMMYSHPGGEWPTLRELIKNNTRVIYAQYNSNEICYEDRQPTGQCPAGFHDWFVFAAETEYSFASTDDLADTDFSCNIDRGPSDTDEIDFFGINVFTSIPTASNCKILNNKAFLQTHMDACSALNNDIPPNLLLVDCWDVGDVLEVVSEYNDRL